MTKDGSEVVTMTGQGVGRITESGIMHFAATNFYSTSPTGKFAFMNNVITVVEYDADKLNNHKNKIWEWK
jgi:hypothetical protein